MKNQETKKKKINLLLTLNDQGGSIMEWNFDGLAATLRASMAGHPPVVVIDNSNINSLEEKGNE